MFRVDQSSQHIDIFSGLNSEIDRVAKLVLGELEDSEI